jgi:hypothetical protein
MYSQDFFHFMGGMLPICIYVAAALYMWDPEGFGDNPKEQTGIFFPVVLGLWLICLSIIPIGWVLTELIPTTLWLCARGLGYM